VNSELLTTHHSPLTKMQCIVVTPETTVLDEPAEFVALPLYDGEIGIAPHHAPMLGRLGYGEMRVKQAAGTRRFYIDGGFVEVAGDVVSVLTQRAVPADKLQADVAAEQLSSVLAQRAQGEEELDLRERRIAQARAQLRVARRSHA
jgi:F-type H+-transporting ATPase subunit epsilon